MKLEEFKQLPTKDQIKYLDQPLSANKEFWFERLKTSLEEDNGMLVGVLGREMYEIYVKLKEYESG